jgi:phosphoglucomutase
VTGVSPLAAQRAPAAKLVDVAKLVTAYFAEVPDPAVPAERVTFGTSGHRGSSFARSFNEWHILAITQAICDYRRHRGIGGPLFIGVDTHALSAPAAASALEVLAANAVEVMLAAEDAFTPTPAVSHAIVGFNRGRSAGFADGIVVTPSHNPPEDGGFKYDPPSGGPADTTVTAWIEARANQYLVEALKGVQRVPHAKALRAATTHRHDYRTAYVNDLENVIDFDVVRGAGVKVGVDPLGGASVQYWPVIAERYGLDLTVVNTIVDERFAFMTLDWDGRIRMDPSSAYAMQRAIALKDSYDLVVACDTDADRHGIVTPGAGLLPPNHYLTVAIDHLFAQRPNWKRDAGVGKTVVSSATIDRIAAKRGLRLYEVPVGFKWFVEGLGNGSLGFAGEESAGASFLRRDGTVWTTDKDGIVAALLAAEITASAGRDPGELYASLTRELGDPRYDRVEAPATAAQRKRLGALTAQDVTPTTLAGEKVQSVVSEAPGNRAPIGGVKVSAASAWFAVRPSGTEDIYKIYAESFKGEAHLAAVVAEAHAIVNALL